MTRAGCQQRHQHGEQRESFTYQATDANGNTDTGTITVNIVDDVPTANADTDSVTEGAHGHGQRADRLTDDVFGADGPTVAGARVVGVCAPPVATPRRPVTTGVGATVSGSLRHADAERERQLHL